VKRDGRVNILLLGVGDPGHAGEGLADTNMVISLNTKTDQVAMISLPRDLRVKVPGYGYQKINNAHAEGDIPLAVKDC
jgi:anionic cell wall polymer biosynthesis LytR-Cps2A-Psr (LCP) family protein